VLKIHFVLHREGDETPYCSVKRRRSSRATLFVARIETRVLTPTQSSL